jgi:hypothetical protein
MQDVQTGLTKKRKKKKEKKEEEKKQDMWAVVPYRISKPSYIANIIVLVSRNHTSLRLSRREYVVVGKVLIWRKPAMSGPHYFTMRKCKVRTETEDMSPNDVAEFWADIIDAGARLADLVDVKYPDAHLVDDALFAVTEIVECFGRKGQWVTSLASSAGNDFLATDSVRKVSGCVAFIGESARSVLFTFSLL